MLFLLVLSIDTPFAPELSILDGVTPYISEDLAGSEDVAHIAFITGR